jgi:hypothetical protein
MTTQKAILIAAAMISAAIIIFAFLSDRYQIITGTTGTVWRVDKITGALSLCFQGSCVPYSN